MKKATALGFGAALLLGSELGHAQSAQPDRQQCVEAYEGAQIAMRRARLAQAREQIRQCLLETCPGMLRTDCAQWLRDVDARQPTIVLEMKGSRGEALTDVEVKMDGAPLATRIDGRALEVDPGEHELVFAAKGQPVVRTRAVVKEGEKLQRVVAELPRRDPPKRDTPLPSGSRPVPWTVFALGGIGVAAAGGFAYFGLSGLSKKDGLEGCKPDCPHDDVVAVRTRFVAADVLLGVSVVSLAAAGVILLVTRGSTQTARGGDLLGGTF